MIQYGGDVPLEALEAGISRKILVSSGSLMMVEVYFKEGGIGQPHAHDRHEQISHILKGSFEVTVNGESGILKTGDSFYAGKTVSHGVRALEESIILDIFSPIREDFLNLESE
jgi:quercetin dioxygenase-like cupin family protein